MASMPESSALDRTDPVVQLLRPDEVADLLGVSIRYVRYLAAAGALPKIRLGRRSSRYRLADVEALIDRRQVVLNDDDPALTPGRAKESARTRRHGRD
jgi:excisionase family DNA binding protein